MLKREMGGSSRKSEFLKVLLQFFFDPPPALPCYRPDTRDFQHGRVTGLWWFYKDFWLCLVSTPVVPS